MSTKSPRKRIEDAFDARTLEEFGQKYLELLYSNWSDSVRTLRRTVLLCVILVASFFLLDHAKSATLTVGPLKTSNIYALLTLIPAAASFLLFEAIDLTLAGSYYQDTASEMMRRLYPRVYENDLEHFLEPTTGFAWGVGSTSDLAPQSSSKLKTVLGWADGLVIGGIILSVIGFLVHAYIRLYGSSHTSLIAVSLSLAFALFNIVRASLNIFALD